MLGLTYFKSADSFTIKEYLMKDSMMPVEGLRWGDIFTHKCRFSAKFVVIDSASFIKEKLHKFANKMHWKRVHQPY